jgi:hypothetical protein
MTAPPVPTVAAQDAWYELVVGNVNPSAADTVPNVTYLQPTGDQPGLTGSLDGEIIYLAGLNSRLDGGQKFLMWDEASLAVQDLVNIFNPWPLSTPRHSWPMDLDQHPSEVRPAGRSSYPDRLSIFCHEHYSSQTLSSTRRSHRPQLSTCRP